MVVAAFLLLATAAAAAPLFFEVAANAAWRSAVDAVPATALAADAPVVRLIGGAAPSQEEQGRLLDQLRLVRGLGEPQIVGASIGTELAGRSNIFRPTVSANGNDERARLYAEGELADALAPAEGSPAPSPDDYGLWIPATLAEKLAVGPGDALDVAVETREGTRSASALVTGVYRVEGDGRRPVDPAGDGRWTARAGQLPRDSEFAAMTSYLLIGTVGTIGPLAEKVGEQVFWTAEAGLERRDAPLSQIERTAADVEELGRSVTDPQQAATTTGALRTGLVSGIPDLVQEAGDIRTATVAQTSSLAWAGVALGLLAVVAVAVLGAVRRRLELSLGAGLGLSPRTVGAQSGAEVLPAAVLAVVVGPLLAWAVLRLPEVSRGVAVEAVLDAAVAVLAAVVAVALVHAVAAYLAARPDKAGPARARLPWDLLLGVAAVTAALGASSRGDGGAAGGTAGWLDLLVPVLVVAASGAVGGRLLLLVTGTAARRLGGGRPGSHRAAVGWLALRRLAAPDGPRLLALTLLTTGLGMLLYALTAVSSVSDVSLDRASVTAGASATAEIDGSWQVHDDPVPRPVPDAEGVFPASPPEATWPSLPQGTTVVLQRRGKIPTQFGNVDVLLVDPEQLRQSAAWGRGPFLERAREALQTLVAADRGAGPNVRSEPLPALVVGRSELQAGQAASLDLELTFSSEPLPIDVVEVLPAFPGASPLRPTVVVSQRLLDPLTIDDPRYRPVDGPSGISLGGDLDNNDNAGFPAQLWTAGGPEELDRVLTQFGVEPADTATLAQAELEPRLAAARRGLGYQRALGLCLAALAALALCLYADRSAARGRAADLLLRRVGLGRAGPGQARVIELALTGAAALLLALVGVALVTPLADRLVDGSPGPLPALTFRPTLGAVAATLAAALLAVALAAAVIAARGRTGTDGEVMRDAE